MKRSKHVTSKRFLPWQRQIFQAWSVMFAISFSLIFISSSCRKEVQNIKNECFHILGGKDLNLGESSMSLRAWPCFSLRKKVRVLLADTPTEAQAKWKRPEINSWATTLCQLPTASLALLLVPTLDHFAEFYLCLHFQGCQTQQVLNGKSEHCLCWFSQEKGNAEKISFFFSFCSDKDKLLSANSCSSFLLGL